MRGKTLDIANASTPSTDSSAQVYTKPRNGPNHQAEAYFPTR
jgi:hypothetical protein